MDYLILEKVGLELNLKQLLLRFYQQRRPQKQLGVFLSPTQFPNYPGIFVVVIYFIFYLIISCLPLFSPQFLLTFPLATTFL